MATPDHSLFPSDAVSVRCARRWLLLGVAALGVAGIFAGLLANTKSPYFYTALVVHVDLSVLVWFLTMACMLFTLAGQGGGWFMLADASFLSFTGGAVLVALSAITGGEAIMSNYVPVIRHPVFFLGLGLIFCGTLGTALNFYVSFAGKGARTVAEYGVYCAGIILVYATGCFVAAGRGLPAEMQGHSYYEYLFWDGGHVLQFVHTQLMLVCWLWLASAAGLQWKIRDRVIEMFFLFGVLAVSFWVLYIYVRLPDIAGDEHHHAFTRLMIDMNGFAPVFMGAFILFSFVIPAKAGTSLSKISLLMSLLLFAGGGVLGELIRGSNVTVPAHYHGSIVGITLAFMGVVYLLLPAFGWADVSRWRLALWQPIIYGGGQLCWMAGMAILGAHGVPRKTPGSADTVGALAAFLKHGGDGLALIGGLLFVYVVLRAVWKKEPT